MTEALESWLSAPDHHLLQIDDPHYPFLLREIPRPPPVLFVCGNLDALMLPQLAIVGSRNASAEGADTSRSFAAHLAGTGFCITSGLAEGIDAAAHLGALQAPDGRTIAVCGTGPDTVYPRRHTGLARQIVISGGAIVSEFAPGTPVSRSNFPRRNRIISGLATGVLVVEASVRSGALITARHAMEQGREVFAIPGSIHNPVARGCHQLIREGARLVETAADIVDELGALLAGLQSDDAPGQRSANHIAAAAGSALPATQADAAHAELLGEMGCDPVAVDVLAPRCGLTIGELSSMLLILELQGLVRSLAGGRYQRVNRSVE
jgi:DNA processing protein